MAALAEAAGAELPAEASAAWNALDDEIRRECR